MPARIERQQAMAEVEAPRTASVRKTLREYLDRASMAAGDFAAEIGYGKSSLQFFLRGSYPGDPRLIACAAWNYMERHPLHGDEDIPRSLHRTGDTKTLLSLAKQARAKARIIVVEGPPGTSKTTALKWYWAERNRRHTGDTLYLRAFTGITGPELLRRLGALVGARRTNARGQRLDNLVRRLRAQRPAVLLIDEAQHLVNTSIEPFEQLRDVVDMANCGCLLAGHFYFVHSITNGLGSRLEQWVSRVDLPIPLCGLSRSELLDIAQAALGQSLPASLRDDIVRACTVRDRNATARARFFRRLGRVSPARTYLSFRRLQKFFDRVADLRQVEENRGQPLPAVARRALGLLLTNERAL